MYIRRFLLPLLASCGSLLLGACSTPARELESLTVSPQAANTMRSVVQFEATDNWNISPTKTTPTNASWGYVRERFRRLT